MPIQKNYRQLRSPRQWVSAYQPINYLFDAPTENATFSNSSGNLQVSGGLFMNSFTLLKTGDLVYITAGIYKGYHTIKSVGTITYLLGVPLIMYVLNTAYTVSDTTREIKYMQPPVFSVFKGWQTNEVPVGVSPNPYPYLKVSDFSPEGNKDGFFEFNISGYVQSALLPIVPPKQGNQFNIDNGYNLYMPFRVVFFGSFISIHRGLCAGVDTEELFSKYINTKQYLGESIANSTCQTNFITLISGTSLFTGRIFSNTPLPRRAFNDRFNSRFLNT
jgi:hypothetical protein